MSDRAREVDGLLEFDSMESMRLDVKTERSGSANGRAILSFKRRSLDVRVRPRDSPAARDVVRVRDWCLATETPDSDVEVGTTRTGCENGDAKREEAGISGSSNKPQTAIRANISNLVS